MSLNIAVVIDVEPWGPYSCIKRTSNLKSLFDLNYASDSLLRMIEVLLDRRGIPLALMIEADIGIGDSLLNFLEERSLLRWKTNKVSLGLHVHAWRKRNKNGFWFQEFWDEEYQRMNCEYALKLFNYYNIKPRFHRQGWLAFSKGIFNFLGDRQIVDLTAEPGHALSINDILYRLKTRSNHIGYYDWSRLNISSSFIGVNQAKKVLHLVSSIPKGVRLSIEYMPRLRPSFDKLSKMILDLASIQKVPAVLFIYSHNYSTNETMLRQTCEFLDVLEQVGDARGIKIQKTGLEELVEQITRSKYLPYLRLMSYLPTKVKTTMFRFLSQI